MTIAKLVLMLLCLVPVTLGPKEAKVTPLFSKDDKYIRASPARIRLQTAASLVFFSVPLEVP